MSSIYGNYNIFMILANYKILSGPSEEMEREAFYAILLYDLLHFAIILAVCAVIIASFYKIFKKNGKPGWYSLIPILNIWTLFEIAGVKGWLCLIPFVNIFYYFISIYKITIKMGESFGLAIIIMLLPVIGLPILASSNYTLNMSDTTNNY